MGRRIPGSVQEEQVQEAIARTVNVETFKAVVQLSGFAKTEAERQKAGQLARSVRGVKDVKNDIRIK